ncbi:unnamed protein product, partial [Discosporangium mesarthrocarpum]
VADTLDSTKHPEVINGRRTADEMFREFLDTFDMGGLKNAKVTREDFLSYYSILSLGIEDDNYFELMMKNTWHL